MSSIKLFESKHIRSEWDESKQKWYFAIIDVVEILTESNNPRRYWSDLKRKLDKEGYSQLYENIVQLKMISSDGKRYVTDCANAKGFIENKVVARIGGKIAGNALMELEKESGEKVITSENYLPGPKKNKDNNTKITVSEVQIERT